MPGLAGSRVLRIAFLSALLYLVLGSVASAGPAVAQERVGCVVVVDGRDVRSATDPSDPIVVRLDQPVTISARLVRPATSVQAWIVFGSQQVQVYDDQAPSHETSWTGTVDGRPYALFGAGLYQVRAAIGDCLLDVWVKVESAQGLFTVAGIASSVLLVTGIGMVGLSVLRVLRGGHAWLLAILGGAIAGLALLVVTQQLGVRAIDATEVVTWTIVPAAVSGGLQGVLAALRGAVPVAGMPLPGGSLPGGSLPGAPGPGGPAPGGSPAGAGVPGAAGGAVPGGMMAGAGYLDSTDPPRQSFARLAAPDAVIVGSEFELWVGLAPESDPQVVGGPMRRPDSSTGSWRLTVQILADGFRLTRAGETWRMELPVTASAPYPVGVLHLAADPGAGPVTARSLRAMFSVDGQPIGLAVRPIAVVADARSLAGTARLDPQPDLDLQPPQAAGAPDLTVRIELGDGPGGGRLLWQLLAANPAVALPDAPLVVDIGGEPAAFLRFVIREMNSAEGHPNLFQSLRGIGRRVAEQVPEAFWTVLADVAGRVGDRSVSLLVLSAEPYVPWELAVMETPLDAAAPPFLAAQVDIGRWVLGQRRPRLPPPATLDVAAMAVVSGVYDANTGWQRLLDAEQEAAELATAWHAQGVDARSEPVVALLEGQPRADVLHFAVHGQYDPNGEIDGLVLVDGPLEPTTVTGSDLAGTPFVFLNACQVGSGNVVLGDYAGMADAFLSSGAAAVVAPLWSIDDVLARELALRFYRRVFAGEPPAAVLREERRAFRKEASPVSSTMLAYQFFGHPRMVLGASAAIRGGQ